MDYSQSALDFGEESVQQATEWCDRAKTMKAYLDENDLPEDLQSRCVTLTQEMVRTAYSCNAVARYCSLLMTLVGETEDMLDELQEELEKREL